MPKPPHCVKIQAPAKVNLFLKVLGKRPDGYHDLYSILQMVSLYDKLVFEKSADGIKLHTQGPGLPTHEENLVVQAARLLTHVTKGHRGVRISLIKHIPVGAGLGGGSSDAAATLVALNRLWGLGYTREELAKLGQELGSDVPFFLHGPVAFVSGRGEKVFPLLLEDDRWLVLINPDFQVSTRWVYQNLKTEPSRFSSLGFGLQKQWLTNQVQNIKIQDSRRLRLSYSDLRFYNDLERVTEVRYPIVREMKIRLQDEGAEAALMSGSGPTVFGLFRNRSKALAAARRISDRHPGWRIWAVKALRCSPF